MADSKVSELTSAGALTGAELVYVVRFGDATPDRKTNVQTIADLAQPKTVPIKVITGAYALLVADAGYVLRSTSATAITIGLSTSTVEPFPVGSVVTMRQVAAGQLTISASVSVIMNVPDGRVAKTRGVGSTLMLHKVGTDEWDLTGDLASS